MAAKLISGQRSSQRGVALIVSLVMLVAITLLGVFVMSNSHLEWLMTNNSRFQSDATLRAGAAVQDAIQWVKSDIHHTGAPAAPPADPRDPANWEPSNPLGGAPSATSISAPGTNQYYVEYLGCSQSGGPCGPCSFTGDVCIYTYRAWGRSSDAKGTDRIVQATVIKRESAFVPVGPGQGTIYTPEIIYTSYAEIAP